MAGITPVSQGGDSIGGTIAIESAAPQFAGRGQGIVTHGGVSAFHRTNGVVNGGNAWLSTATENFRIGYTGSYVNANNYKNGAGAMVKSTFYETQNHALQLAARRGSHLVTVDLGYQRIPQQGFANARMDMTRNEAKSVNVSYGGAFSWGELDARVYYGDTRHEMNILRDKIPGMNMPMETRGANLGYAVQAEVPLSGRDTLRIGNEFRRFTLDDWWPPVIEDGRQHGAGYAVERAGRQARPVRNVRRMGDPARQGMDGTDRRPRRGGADEHRQRGGLQHVDHHHGKRGVFGRCRGVQRARPRPPGHQFRPDRAGPLRAARPTRMFEFGYARKTRSPGIYERYLWVKRSAMSVQMNGWFGDGNGYTGNLNLRPEVANTFSATAGWRAAAKDGWELKITPYYTRVQDYIDVDRCPVIADGSNGCTAARFAATSGFVTLQFANHAARLYGVDASWRAPLGGNAGMGRFALLGVFGYVRGENLDNGGNLYQIMPVNGRVGLEHRRGNWSSAFDFQAVDAKRDVQAVRNELATPGYALAQPALIVSMETGRKRRSPAGCRNRQSHEQELRPTAGRALLDRRQDGKDAASRHGALGVQRSDFRILIGCRGIPVGCG